MGGAYHRLSHSSIHVATLCMRASRVDKTQPWRWGARVRRALRGAALEGAPDLGCASICCLCESLHRVPLDGRPDGRCARCQRPEARSWQHAQHGAQLLSLQLIMRTHEVAASGPNSRRPGGRVSVLGMTNSPGSCFPAPPSAEEGQQCRPYPMPSSLRA